MAESRIGHGFGALADTICFDNLLASQDRGHTKRSMEQDTAVERRQLLDGATTFPKATREAQPIDQGTGFSGSTQINDRQQFAGLGAVFVETSLELPSPPPHPVYPQSRTRVGSPRRPSKRFVVLTPFVGCVAGPLLVLMGGLWWMASAVLAKRQTHENFPAHLQIAVASGNRLPNDEKGIVSQGVELQPPQPASSEAGLPDASQAILESCDRRLSAPHWSASSHPSIKPGSLRTDMARHIRDVTDIPAGSAAIPVGSVAAPSMGWLSLKPQVQPADARNSDSLATLTLAASSQFVLWPQTHVDVGANRDSELVNSVDGEPETTVHDERDWAAPHHTASRAEPKGVRAWSAMKWVILPMATATAHFGQEHGGATLKPAHGTSDSSSTARNRSSLMSPGLKAGSRLFVQKYLPPIPGPSLPAGDRLLNRGKALLRRGDVASARILFARALQQGTPLASFFLAQTYDPEILASRQNYGTRPDVDISRKLYDSAARASIDEAMVRTHNQ